MAFPSYTYTFSNGTTADASQANQNFTDILNGISDTTKDISVSAMTAAGAATLNGNVTLGNGAAKTITVNGSLSSSFPIATNTTYDIGSATLGLRAAYIGGTSTFTTAIKSAATASWTLTLPVTAGSANNFLKGDGSGNLSWQSTVPTIQRFTSGSGTYNLPTGCLWIRLVMIGGGGGGAGSGTNAVPGSAGGNGGDTTFGSNTAAKGSGAPQPSGGNCVGGAGGVATTGIGSGLFQNGAQGCAGTYNNSGASPSYSPGGQGGQGPFGGAGAPQNTGAGLSAQANSGAGGAGGGTSSTTNMDAGGGGGAGAYIDVIVTSPSATYSYGVGAAGSNGTAGTSGFVGGSGGAGLIVVYEYYG